jgi:cytidylate kinase
MVAEEFSLKCVHTSGVLKQLKESREVDVDKSEMNVGFYESDEGKEFMKERMENEAFDKALDKKLLEIIEEDNVAMDSWTMPWLSEKGVKVWLKVSDDIRAERLAGRDKRNADEVLQAAKEKEENTRKLLKNLYDFNFGEDLSVFDLIVDTDNKSIEEVFQEVKKFLEEK